VCAASRERPFILQQQELSENDLKSALGLSGIAEICSIEPPPHATVAAVSMFLAISST